MVFTDNNGIFRVNLTDIDTLGNFSLSFTYLGDKFRLGSTDSVDMWVVSRTFINVQSMQIQAPACRPVWHTAQLLM